MIEIVYFFLQRIFDLLQIPLLLLLLGVVGSIFQRCSVKTNAWLVAIVLGTVAWRFMWLSSAGGRSTRYFIVWIIVVILLIRPGILGYYKLWNKIRIRYQYYSHCCWLWLLGIILLSIMINLGRAFTPPDHKNFLFEVKNILHETSQLHLDNSGVVLLDSTSEFERLQYLADTKWKVIALPKRTQGHDPERIRGKELIDGFIAGIREGDQIFLLSRRQRECQRESFPAPFLSEEIIREFSYRKYIYTISRLCWQTYYTSDELEFIQDFREVPQQLVLSSGNEEEFVLPYQMIFPIQNLGDFYISVSATLGTIWENQWTCKQKDLHGPETSVTLTLWNQGNRPLVRQQVVITTNSQNKRTDFLIPMRLVSSKPPTDIIQISEALIVPTTELKGEAIFFGNSLFRVSGLKEWCKSNISQLQVINTTSHSGFEKTWNYADNLDWLCKDDGKNPYFSNHQLTLGEKKAIAFFFFIPPEIQHCEPADLFWPVKFRQLQGKWLLLIKMLHGYNPERKIIIATLPEMPSVAYPVVPDYIFSGDRNIYNQAVRNYNQLLLREFSTGKHKNIQILPLHLIEWDNIDFESGTLFTFSSQGRDKFLNAIKKFVEDPETL